MNPFVFMTHSCCIDFWLWIRYNSRCTSSMVAQSLQSNMAATIIAHLFVHDIGPSKFIYWQLFYFFVFVVEFHILCILYGLVERCIYVGSWSSCPSQILRDRCRWVHSIKFSFFFSRSLSFHSIIDPFSSNFRSTRCPPWLLLRPYWLAIFNTASWSRSQAENRRLERFTSGSDCYVAKALEHSIVCIAGHCDASTCATLSLGRRSVGFVLGEFQFPLLCYIEHCILCKQFCTFVWK